MNQLSDMLHPLLSTAFTDLAESMRARFANLGELTQDIRIPADSEISSESRNSGNEGSDKDETNQLSAKQPKTADYSQSGYNREVN